MSKQDNSSRGFGKSNVRGKIKGGDYGFGVTRSKKGEKNEVENRGGNVVKKHTEACRRRKVEQQVLLPGK